MTNVRNLKIAAGALVLLFALFGVYSGFKSQTAFGSITPTQSTRYNLIGTAAAPLTLSSSFTGGGSVSSTGRLSKSQPNIVLAGTYTPKSHGSSLNVLIERSIDDGATYRPYNVLEITSSEVLVHTSGTVGVPFTVPGSGVSVSGTAIGFDLDLTMAADYVRVSAKENTTSTAGTIYGQIYFQSQ